MAGKSRLINRRQFNVALMSSLAALSVLLGRELVETRPTSFRLPLLSTNIARKYCAATCRDSLYNPRFFAMVLAVLKPLL